MGATKALKVEAAKNSRKREGTTLQNDLMAKRQQLHIKDHQVHQFPQLNLCLEASNNNNAHISRELHKNTLATKHKRKLTQ